MKSSNIHTMTLATIIRISFQVTQKHERCHQRAILAIRQAPLTLCPAMLTGRSVLQEERKKKNGGEKMNKCRGMLWKQRGLQNRVTCSCKIRGSRSHCIDLHNRACVFCWVRNRPLLESQPHISHCRASNSLAGWRMKQQSLQCCNGKDMGRKIGLS